MRFEFDREANALYIYLQEIPYGAVARTIEIEDGANLDIARDGQVLGIEFLDLDDFWRFLEHHNGQIVVPEYVEVDRASKPSSADRAGTLPTRF
jgi:uncharacterized protein YuzE